MKNRIVSVLIKPRKLGIIALLIVILFIAGEMAGCSKTNPNPVQPADQEELTDQVVQKPKMTIDAENKVDFEEFKKEVLESSIEQREVPAKVRFDYYPSGADFIASVINQRDNVEITEEMRENFNLFARDYRWIFMPDIDGYESFFETTNFGSSYGYTNFAGAVFYVLHYMGCPEKMSDEAMQDAIQSLFAAKTGYENMPHQAYRKFASYEDGYYSPWPEGGIDHNRMFYSLTAMDVHHDAAEDVYITVRVTSYYFEDTSVFEAGENEKWLAERSEKLGIPELQAAAKLIASGEMGELEGDREFETTMYIKAGGENPRGLNPQFIFSRSRSIPYDDPF